MESGGARTWYFPDGWLPEKTPGGALEAHEATMILNTSSRGASVSLDISFEKGDPVKDIPVAVPAERVICLRLDRPEELGGVRIQTATQYAIRRAPTSTSSPSSAGSTPHSRTWPTTRLWAITRRGAGERQGSRPGGRRV